MDPILLSLILFCVGLVASCTAAVLECLATQRVLATENANLKALLYREAPLFPDLAPITRRRTPRPPPFPLPPIPELPMQSKLTRVMTIAIPLVRPRTGTK